MVIPGLVCGTLIKIMAPNPRMQTGILYIVATPIGNLEDISARAIRILREVDLIAAEDTRHSQKLLQHYAINTKTISLHNFNEEKKTAAIIEQLQAGKNIALISDAGTPLINDPGFRLVTAAQNAKIKVVPIPGPCAAITALCASGLSTINFTFEGFLPYKTQALKQKLETLARETRTIIIYEAPHRLLNLLQAMLEVLGVERKIVLAKELTKTFETIKLGTIPEIQDWLHEDVKRQQGEFAILIEGANMNAKASDMLDEETLRIFNILKSELSTSQAAKLTSKITGIKKQLLFK
jgi:16S rRNA (cytidine1402-2'-O)-methyltransferase